MSEEKELVRKLAHTWHLSVPERKELPNRTAKASLLYDAIETDLCSAGWYPPTARPDDDFTGGIIELTNEGTCRIHWKTQVSTSHYESGEITSCKSPREAAEILLRNLFPEHIDGIAIDWVN
jgi:hypothetical protein